MAEPTEPRALSAALSAPAFATRGAGLAMHVADRHVERWAPEAGANRVRPLRSLGFVDRLIAPWIETAQRSASMRLFGQYNETGFAERSAGAVSWVFPRPWYQDELDWMAAARHAPQHEASMFTTRGTYVAPQQQRAQTAAPMAMPAALYEYVAPSMSIAAPAGAGAVAGVGYGGESMHADAYSPLIPLAAVQAANLMARTVAPALAPVTSGARMSPALRNVLSAMIERAAVSRADEPGRLARSAPEMVTPPAPSAPDLAGGAEAPPRSAAGIAAEEVAQQYAAQRAQIVEVQRIAQRAAERELTARHAETTERAAATAAAAMPVATATAMPSATAAATTAPGAERVVELREAALRGEAQLRETTAARTEEQRQKLETERAAVTAERSRLEERVAQRVTERTAAQRLHEQARAEAAEHVRAPLAETPASHQAASAEGRTPVVERRPPAEVAQAIAALPPELAAFIGQRPGRAMQAIEELEVALRTIELIAHGAASGATFEATRGPRLVMPAGIGGLVSAVDRAHALETPMAARPVLASAPGLALAAAPALATASVPTASTRVPSLPWLAAPRSIGAAQAASAAMPRTTALGATAAAAPAALAHVAWADRWLARFAGASKVSLDTFAAAGTTRMEALAAAAPEGVFVSPFFDIERDAEPARDVARLVAANERRPTLITPPAPVIRYADDAETPDDVFAQISAAASRQRTQPGAAPSAFTATTAATATFAGSQSAAALAAPISLADRTPADAIAASAPSAPNAGLSAQLAASPFAPALRHVMPMPSAASFDVRSLFGGGLSATYLAGLLSAESRELEIVTRALPGWASPGLESFGGDLAAERAVPAWDPTYVAPDAPDAADAFDAVSPDAPVTLEPAARTAEHSEAAIAVTAPLTTLRAALLSWSAEVPVLGGSPGFASAELSGSSERAGESAAAPASATMLASIAGMPVSTARAMLESMSLPMLGDVAGTDDHGGAWMAPGMVASRAHSWSVAQERSASDLALDFVTPELVLAARVYGLGPSEAAQAARLAIAGSGHLTAMAGTVDRTFLQAMAIDADRRERLATLTTVYPVSSSPSSASPADAALATATAATPSVARAESPRATAESFTPMIAGQSPAGTAFGVDRRPPRGAFLWPSASVAALGLNAAGSEGQQAMSVAALELLAARAVAELGTFAALEDPGLAEARDNLAGSPGGAGAAGFAEIAGISGAAASTAFGPSSGLAPRADGTFAGAAVPTGFAPGASGEPGERDVLAAAGELVPSSRRARFDALYLALGQSSVGRSWSPAARAARAFALAGQTDEAPVSARERAASAWDVLPVVYASEGLFDGDVRIAADGSPIASTASPQGVAAHASRGFAAGAAPTGELVGGYAGAGLGALSSRAGEALGSYVAPFAPAPVEASSSSGRDRGEQGAVLRAPTAMQELVRTGRPAGRHGGGEVEIPPWFEAAARKMFENQGSISDGISIAELTLVTAAPSTHIAASTRAAPTAASATPAASAAPEKGGGAGIDVESTAQEIYRYILTMMDAARARNGEPYL